MTKIPSEGFPDLSDVVAGQLWEQGDVPTPRQKANLVLCQRLIPPSGMAATTRGEALRAINSVYLASHNSEYAVGVEMVRFATVVSHFVACLTDDSPQHDIIKDASERVLSRMAGYVSLVDAWEEEQEVYDPNAHRPQWEDQIDSEYLLDVELCAVWVIEMAAKLDAAAVIASEASGLPAEAARSKRQG